MNINKHKVELADGVYDALWSGYKMEIVILNEENVFLDTVIGVKGINCKTIVKVKNGLLSVIR